MIADIEASWRRRQSTRLSSIRSFDKRFSYGTPEFLHSFALTITSFMLNQSVELGFNFENESISGVTSLWLGFKDDICTGSVFYLHCRQCQITQVRVNNVLFSRAICCCNVEGNVIGMSRWRADNNQLCVRPTFFASLVVF